MRKFEFGSRQLVIIALSTAVYSVLNWVSAAFQVVPGASLVFPATAAAIVFTMWFGIWGAIGVFLGTIIGGFAWGTTVLVSFVGGFHNILEGIIPALVFYYWPGLRKDLGNAKSLIAYVLFAVILGTFVNALLGNLNYVLWGYSSLDYALKVGLWPWWLADAVAAVALGIPLLISMTRFVEKTSLYHQGFIARRKGGFEA